MLAGCESRAASSGVPVNWTLVELEALLTAHKPNETVLRRLGIRSDADRQATLERVQQMQRRVITPKAIVTP